MRWESPQELLCNLRKRVDTYIREWPVVANVSSGSIQSQSEGIVTLPYCSQVVVEEGIQE